MYNILHARCVTLALSITGTLFIQSGIFDANDRTGRDAKVLIARRYMYRYYLYSVWLSTLYKI